MKILSYEEAARAGPAVAGGKGWNLGRLARFGFPVPTGGVVPAGLYRERMRLVDARGAGDLAAVRAAIESAGVGAEAEAAVAEFLAASGLEDSPVAVRSSATAEDGSAASFAGIHGSFLGVTGAAEVSRAIARCFATLWTEQALAYRGRMGVADDEIACAVVICEMVRGPGGEPAAAGVAFSADPRTGRRDRVVINAVRGLADRLVSGAVAPEEIVLEGDPRFGSDARVERTGAAGALDDARAHELARLVRRVEWALGDGQDPQDVEWAHDGSRFLLVQARPVTRLPRRTIPAAASLPLVWSNANLKDVVPGVQTPFSWSAVTAALREILFAGLESVGYRMPPGVQQVRRIHGRAYFDLTTLAWGSCDAFGVTPAELNAEFGGHQPEIPFPTEGLLEGPDGARRKRARLRMLREAFARRRHDREIAAALAAGNAFVREDLAALTPEGLYAYAARLTEATIPFGRTFQICNQTAGIFNTLLLQRLGRRFQGRARSVASGLMAGGGGVVSAEQGYRVYGLAAALAADPAARALLDRDGPAPDAWRSLPEGSPFRRELARYLDDFGHRAAYESEFANPRWREDPRYILDQARRLAGEGRTEPPHGAARESRRAAEARLGGLGLVERVTVRWLAGRARDAMARREAAKSALVALGEPLRLLALEVGSRLAARGVLDARDDAFYLTLPDVEAFLRGEWDGSGARALVASRRAQRDLWLTEDAEDVYVLDAEGRPATLPASAAAPAPTPADPGGPALAGLGVSAGRAEGVARVVRTPEEGHRLGHGEILVAPSTDPGWTPLFLRAAGIAMEVGGYLSHGAIVAREYGLPAVVNVPGLLARLEDGRRVVVDGDAGEIRLE